MSREVFDRAKGKWKFILAELGVQASFLTNKKGPCPICGGRDRFRFDDKEGSGSWYCNRCGSGYGVHLHQRLNSLSIGQALADVERLIDIASVVINKHSENQKAAFEKAREIWRQSGEIAGGIVSDYLQHARGLSAATLSLTRSIRHYSQMLYLDEEGNFCGRFPAMVGLIQTPDGRATGVHRTYLAQSGQQASVPSPKKVLGTIAPGAAIRLAEHAASIGIGEGIESSLAAMELFAVPTWASINAGGLEKWVPPGEVTHITIFGDNDKNFRGQLAAFALANRLVGSGYVVEVKIPPQTGYDWNDVLLARKSIHGDAE